MKLKILFFTIFIFLNCFPNDINAQNVKLNNSTLQGWSGGIAGHYGENYIFDIEFTGYETAPIPDTIWIEHLPVPLTIYDAKDPPNGNTRRTIKRKSVRYEIAVGTSHDEYAEREQQYSPNKKQDDTPPLPPKKYKGVALISYQANGSQHFFEVSKFLKKLESANYP